MIFCFSNFTSPVYTIFFIYIIDEKDSKTSGLNGYWTVYFYETCISNMDLVEDHSINSNQSILFLSENKFLYIITELCAKTLKDVIIDLINNYCQESKMFLNLEGFYIASQLFFELLEALRHLHKLHPPIIHRDLKPSNILITHGNNNRFLKIADIGLATYHEFEDQSHTMNTGSPKYIAPKFIIQRNIILKLTSIVWASSFRNYLILILMCELLYFIISHNHSFTVYTLFNNECNRKAIRDSISRYFL